MSKTQQDKKQSERESKQAYYPLFESVNLLFNRQAKWYI